MKKLLSIVLIAVLFSCSSNIENETGNNTTLKEKLNKFNTDFKYSSFNTTFKEKPPKTKSWWQTVGEVCAIATADAGGAATGVAGVQTVAGIVGAATAGTGYAVVAGGAAVVGAVGGSYAAYATFHPNGRFTNENLLGQSVVYNLPKEFSHITNFGVLHNKELSEIYFELGYSQNLEFDWLTTNLKIPSDYNFNDVYYSNEFQNHINKINQISINYAQNNYDHNFLLNSYKSENLITSNVSDILNLYFSAQSKAEGFDDTKRINEYYINEILNSNLKNEDKESLLSAFVVYIQSYYFWLNFEII